MSVRFYRSFYVGNIVKCSKPSFCLCLRSIAVTKWSHACCCARLTTLLVIVTSAKWTHPHLSSTSRCLSSQRSIVSHATPRAAVISAPSVLYLSRRPAPVHCSGKLASCTDADSNDPPTTTGTSRFRFISNKLYCYTV